MSGNGFGDDGSGRLVARMVTPPPPSPVDGGEMHGTVRNLPCPRHRLLSSSAVPPPRMHECLNVVGNTEGGTQISLGRSLPTSGIFRVAPSNVNVAAASSNTTTSNADDARQLSSSRRHGNDNDTNGTNDVDDDGLYAFLKMPALSHDTMEDTDDDSDEEEEEDDGIVDIVCY